MFWESIRLGVLGVVFGFTAIVVAIVVFKVLQRLVEEGLA